MIFLRRLVRFVAVLMAARHIQDHLWGSTAERAERGQQWWAWIQILDKRVHKLTLIESQNLHWRVEARKRLLQLSALSVAMIELIDEGAIKP